MAKTKVFSGALEATMQRPVSRPTAGTKPAAASRDRRVAHEPLVTITLPAIVGRGGGDAHFRQTVYLMNLAFDRLQTCREAFGRDIALTGSQYAVLIGASHMQGARGISVRALADHVQLAATHVTTEVGRLIRLGLLEKRPNPLDRRGVLVSLSAAGQHRLDRLAPFLQSVNDTLFRDITRQELKAFSNLLTTFVRNSDDALALIRQREASGAETAAERRSPNDKV
jgi:MarR family transcriptional regulator, organic hydroperoxide resistance regulator